MKITSSRQANTTLRALREGAGLNRTQFAKQLHVTSNTLCDRETGRLGLSVDALHATADQLGLEVHLLPRGTVTTGLIAISGRRDLGGLIRDLRRRAELSLGDLAAVLGMTKGGLGNRETNDRAMTVAVLTETLDALGYDLVAVPRPATEGRVAA